MFEDPTIRDRVLSVSNFSNSSIFFLILTFLLVVDIPSEDYLEDLEAKTHLLTANPAVVIHFTQAAILKHPKYEKFLSQFPAGVDHLLANGSHSFSGYVAAHRIQWQLNRLEPQVFPLLAESKFFGDDLNKSCEGLRKKARLEDSPSPQKVVELEEVDGLLKNINTLTTYHLRPLKGLDRGAESVLSPNEYLKELDAVEGFQDLLAKVKAELPSRQRDTFPKILFLGTGSCIPNKTRNVSAILVRIR